MQIRLFVDEDAMSRSLITGLRARGIDVTTVLDEDRIGIGDEEQLEFAAAEGRVLCTSNVGDFYNLHTQYMQDGRNHAGIIFIAQQRFGVGEQLRRILKLVSARTAEAMRNQVEFLSAW